MKVSVMMQVTKLRLEVAYPANVAPSTDAAHWRRPVEKETKKVTSRLGHMSLPIGCTSYTYTHTPDERTQDERPVDELWMRACRMRTIVL
tara:strand:- start:186 stop:455 length:270 start_codon:yes stop_codon:yes gene_type:complete